VFAQSLGQLGWTVGGNLQIDYRFSGGEVDRVRQYAAELVAFAPDVIMTFGSVTVAPVLQATRTIPIVFVNVADPVGAGFVQSLARPGGNATGFAQFEYSLSGKWLELLKEIAPGVFRLRANSGPPQNGRSPLIVTRRPERTSRNRTWNSGRVQCSNR
jgi:putative tryptophan/tyrosine transport system substrate-binding protein